MEHRGYLGYLVKPLQDPLLVDTCHYTLFISYRIAQHRVDSNGKDGLWLIIMDQFCFTIVTNVSH